MANLCEKYLKILLDKTLQKSDWGKRPITEDQLKYAANDSEILFKIYNE